MSKIDCNITENYLKEKARMCKYYDLDCDYCPMIGEHNTSLNCHAFQHLHPTKAIEIVQDWSDENPVKTIKDDFLEKHPNARLHNDLPVVCIKSLGYIGQDYVCPSGTYAECKKCWNRPLEEVQK